MRPFQNDVARVDRGDREHGGPSSLRTALDDSQMVRFQQGLVHQIGQHRSGGVIIEVAALDVLDSFGSRTLSNIAELARLRGAVTVIIGIQPSVAFAMVELGMDASALETALDLEQGLAHLSRRRGRPAGPAQTQPT